MPDPFRYFKTSPGIIRLTVMMYVRFPLSLRQVRAVDHEDEVLEVLVTKRRDRKAALRFLRKAMKRYGKISSSIVPPPSPNGVNSLAEAGRSEFFGDSVTLV
jgi:hypothetical protein